MVNENQEMKKPYLVWDEYEIAKLQAEFLCEENGLSKKEVWMQAQNDSELYKCEWEYLIDSLTEIMKEINPDVKVLMSSGYSINGQARDLLQRGCTGFMQKPFSMEELSKKIREILG